MIAELNKIAIVHLFLLGFEDELSNFTLGLTNPSTQADLLKIDVWKEKVLLYKDAVMPVEGIAPVSVSWAKKNILGFSDEEIKLDLQQQRVEKAVGAELMNTPTVITHSGVFDNIDKLYGTKTGDTTNAEVEPPSSPDGGTAGDDLGGGDLGGDLGGGEIPMESTNRDNLKILLENDDITSSSSFIDLSKGNDSLGEIEKELGKLMKS
jgi:hypothetical protein